MKADFAAAAMLRLVARGLAREGLRMPAPVRGDARVPLADKRTLLLALEAAHGRAMLLRLGQAVVDAPDEPTLTALTAAREPADLVARWQRLERYVHSRHRVRVLHTAPGHLRLAHVSLQPAEPPLPAEDLLVWGLLIGLLQRLGTAGLVADVDLHAPAEMALRWTPSPWSAAAPPGSHAATLSAVQATLSADPAAPWTLARLARQLNLAPRSLQRRLAAAGSSFSAQWMQVRLAASARLLVDGTVSTVEIGYRCGFADQAHFTRSFRRHTALTPARYRAEFAARR